MFHIGREKHLDHMVKVVPFIVTCYGIQCFVIMRFGSSQFSFMALSILGGILALMVSSFIYYDLKHKVTLFEEHLEINFLGKSKTIPFCEIKSILISDPGQSFSTVKLQTSSKTISLYFVDDAEKIKSWIEERKYKSLEKAA